MPVVDLDLAYELHDLVHTLDLAAERILRRERLSYNRYIALIIIADNPGLTGRELARGLRISEPSTSTLVRKLIDADYVRDQSPPGSGNIRHLSVTPDGIAKRDACSRLLEGRLGTTAASTGIDAASLARTIRTLHDAVLANQPPDFDPNWVTVDN